MSEVSTINQIFNFKNIVLLIDSYRLLAYCLQSHYSVLNKSYIEYYCNMMNRINCTFDILAICFHSPFNCFASYPPFFQWKTTVSINSRIKIVYNQTTSVINSIMLLLIKLIGNSRYTNLT